jgi:hypothetical protein
MTYLRASSGIRQDDTLRILRASELVKNCLNDGGGSRDLREPLLKELRDTLRLAR